MKRKKSGFFTKVIIFALLAYGAFSLLVLYNQIQKAEHEKAALTQQIAEQSIINEKLKSDIKNSTDPEKLEQIARERLGLVLPGERIFKDISN